MHASEGSVEGPNTSFSRDRWELWVYPIAYAVTKGETRDSWNWFLENLISDIGPVRNH